MKTSNTITILADPERFSDDGPIRSIKEMWEATIQYYIEGEFDTTAMYNVYLRMNPKLTFQDIANVFSGVFIDTYWNVVKMDASILSKSLVQALGLSRSQADKYSSKAMRQWRGAFVRNNLSDTGQIPSNGSYTQSLDIVCNENTPLMPSQLIENWNNEYWKAPTVGKNYIYTRVQNKDFMGDLDGRVQMFYTTGGFNQPPSSWVQCLTENGKKREGNILLVDNKPGVLSLGDRGASEAFFFNPKSTDHVCVIAAVNNQFFKENDPLGISESNWNSTTWITHNGAAAWHNVNPQTAEVTRLKMYNQDGTQENFVLTGQCRNVPVGSKIQVETKDGHITPFAKKIRSTSELLEFEFSLPGYYAGDLEVTIKGPDGGLLANNAAIEFTMFWNLSAGHRYYVKACDRFDLVQSLANKEEVRTSLGSYTITGAE